MASRAYQSYDDNPAREGSDLPDDCRPAEFYAGERVCPSGTARPRHPARRAAVAVIVALGGWQAWSLIPEDVKFDAAIAIEAAISRRSLQPEEPGATTSASEAEQHTASAAADLPVAPPLAEVREIADVAGAGAGTPAVAPEVPPPEPSEDAEGTDRDADPAPLPPPVVDPSDPYQKRALAAGLHPDLSRALLTRLSDADYRNAGLAVRKALAAPPGIEGIAWPKEGAGGKLALFEVRFVRGASPECRRYVVTVTLARWSTTAAPMEKCGAKGTQDAMRAGMQ